MHVRAFDVRLQRAGCAAAAGECLLWVGDWYSADDRIVPERIVAVFPELWVKQDRSRKEYTTLFPKALRALIRHALAKQVVVAHETVQKLGLSLFEPAFKAVQVALLEPVIAKGEAVLEERKHAELDRVEGRIEIETWKQDVNAVRTSVYAELITLATKLGHKRAWADAFFPAATTRSTSDGDVDDEVEVDELAAEAE